MRDSVRIAIKRISCVFLTILLNSLFLLMGLNRDFNPFLDGNAPWIPELFPDEESCNCDNTYLEIALINMIAYHPVDYLYKEFLKLKNDKKIA